ncbi:MAG: protein kinase [Candidatus Competibacteraceae bacterium]
MTITHPTASSKSGARRANALPSACMLDEYRIDSILGAGGFGVTYKALDTHLENWVAIKEYFPVEWSFRDADGVTVHPNTQGEISGPDGQLSDYLWGLERFLDEARVLARVQHPHVVRVKRYFRAHGTAYIVMEYEEGEPLSVILRDGETLSEDEVRGLLEDVLPALQAVHEQGYLHRDIKPSNLYVRSSDHRVILIDFGAAREAVGRHSKSVTSLVTPGYSPPEQYTTRTDRYGTWTDIYALGAVLYRSITGHTPIEAAERLLDDHLEPAIKEGAGRYSTNLLEAIDRALAVRPEQRFVTVADMQAALRGSQDEDSSQTVIMTPLTKSKAAPAVETARLTGRLSSSAEEPADQEHHHWLDITHSPATAKAEFSRQQQAVLASPRAGIMSRWRLPAVLAGGVTLMAAAATIVWLGSSEPVENKPLPEQKLPPRYSMGAAGGVVTNRLPAPAETPVSVTAPPVATAPDSMPATIAPAPVVDTVVKSTAAAEAREPTSPSVSVEKPGAERGAEPPVSGRPAEAESLEKPPIAEPGRKPVDAGEIAPPLESTPPLPAAGMTGVPLAPSVVPAPVIQPPASTPTRQATDPVTAQKPQVDKATPPTKRATRRKTARKSKEQPVVVTPAQPVRPAAPVTSKRDNLWDPPTESGFNQK